MNLYIIGIYLLIMSVCIQFLDLVYFLPVFMASLVILLIKGRLEDREKILYLLIAGIFFIRGVSGVNFHEYQPGERIKIITEGNLIKKIDGKLPRKDIYLSGIIRGKNYRLTGDISEIKRSRGQTSYKLDILEKHEVEDSLVRRYLEKRIDSLVRGYSRSLRDFYRGIILGEKKDLDRELRDKFSYTGTSHLIVISGLHIGVIIALMTYIAGKLPLSHDTRYIGVIIVLSLYILAVGGSPSVIRAYIMGMCYLCGGLFYEESEGKRSLLLAMIINLIIDPLGAGRISFQLSYIAVFTILFIYPYYEKKVRLIENLPLRWLMAMGGLSFAIQLTLTPVFMMNFRSIPLLSFIVNIGAIPIGVLFVQSAFLALLLSVVSLGGILMPTVNLLYHILVGFIEWTAELPLLSLEYKGVTGGWYPFVIYLIIYLFIKKKTRTLSLIPLVIMILINRERTDNYMGEGYIYYHPEVIVAHKKLSSWDIDEIRDNRIKKHNIMISSKNQDGEVMKRLEIRKLVILGEGEGVMIGQRTFKNTDGTIKRE